MGKCVLNRKWLSDAKLSWVKEFKGDKHKAMCCVCNKVIDIERMGERALKSHMKGEKHNRNSGASLTSAQSVLMTTFLHKQHSSSCDQRSESVPSCAEANNESNNNQSTKFNALRKAAKDTTLQPQEVEDKLNGKLEALKGG